MAQFAQSVSSPVPLSASTVTRRTAFRAGIVAALPLLIGVMPFGVVYGALAVNAGFSPLAAGIMSVFVFAGSAQFLAAGLFAIHSAPIAIILATLIINLRHVLYGAALGKQLRGTAPAGLFGLAFVMTDELFILTQTHIQQFRRRGEDAVHIAWFAAGTATLLYVSWQIATWLGVWGGAYLPNPTRWGLDFALAASFLAFLLPQLTTRPAWVCAAVAATAAVLLRDLPLQSGLILAIVLGVTAALWAERRGNITQQTIVPATGHTATRHTATRHTGETDHDQR